MLPASVVASCAVRSCRRSFVAVVRDLATSRQIRAAQQAGHGKKGGDDKKEEPTSTSFFTSLQEQRPDFLITTTTTTDPAPLAIPTLDVLPSSATSSATKTTAPPAMAMYVDPMTERANLAAFEQSLSIDNAELFHPEIHLTDRPDFTDLSLNYEESTSLGEDLLKLIGTRGPITTAAFMSMALTDPSHGYYTSKTTNDALDHDLFDDDDEKDNDDDSSSDHDATAPSSSAIIGKHGDFVTAPEISQLFGECIFLFYLNQYRTSLGKPSAIQMVEIGPGKGTLMSDMLNTACFSFPEFADALCTGGGVHLVEVSPDMRRKQLEALEKLNKKLTENSSKYKLVFVNPPSSGAEGKEDDTNNDEPIVISSSNTNDIHVHWHNSLTHVPPADVNGKNIPHFILCQEFVDALPIHSFQKHADGTWKERMVDVATVGSDDDKDMDRILLEALPDQQQKPRLRFVLSQDSTPAVKTLLNLPPDEESQEGDVIEVCPAGLMLALDISARVSQCQGASLLIDYGTEFGSGDTLRGFYKHTQVHPLSLPGRVDVTADVVFGGLRQQADKVEGVTCHGPTSQGGFLSSLGALERVISLMEKDEVSDEQAEELYRGFERLVSPEEMGVRYKVLGIVSGKESNIPGFSNS